MSGRRTLLAAMAVVLVAAAGLAPSVLGAHRESRRVESAAGAARSPVPFLAYYYIWFDRSSWDRAKQDLPLLGPYTSDDAAVARQHIRWAKAAGITGFLVSWKSTPILNRRLELLIQAASEEHFTLGIVYQGLDFDRHPQPAGRVAADLRYFADHYASDPVFKIFEKPLVIFAGTWAYSATDLASVTSDLRNDLLVLASEKNLAGFERVRGLVDGDAYYWSSVNPGTYSAYQDKLNAMAGAVHAAGGLWIAPAAPGYDGTLLGGTAIVDRKGGDTLRQEVRAAIQSGPDAVGLISWNEFSENTYVEPSRRTADRYLQVLSELNALPAPPVDLSGSTDDQPGAATNGWEVAARLAGLAVAAAVIGVVPIVLARRARRRRRPL